MNLLYWLAVFVLVAAASVYDRYLLQRELVSKDQELTAIHLAVLGKCQAAKETVLDEGLLVQAGHVRPGEQLTDRWKALLAGCE